MPAVGALRSRRVGAARGLALMPVASEGADCLVWQVLL